MTSTTDENGVVDSYAYNSLGEVTQAILPQTSGVTATYSYTYDSVGNELTAVTPLTGGGSPTSATTAYAYDAMNRVTKVTDPMGFSTLYAFDNAGNLTGMTDQLGHTTTYGYDGASRLIEEVDPVSSGVSATTLYSLDPDGRVTAVVDPLGNTTQYSYNSRGWLASVTQPQGDVTAYGYDAIGDQTSVTQTDTHSHSTTTTMAYDHLGLLTQTVDPLGLTTAYTYDKDNNLSSIEGFNQDQVFSYDALDRLVTTTVAGFAATTRYYDKVGNVTETTDPLSNATVNTYDDQGRLLTQVDPDGTGTTTYAYNLSGWQTSEVTPGSSTTSYAYNLDGWVTATTNPTGHTATNNYDQAGRVTSTVDYDNKTTNYAYNYAGWETSETWVGGSYTANYSYNLDGELTAASDPASTYAFSYDNNGQLTQTQVSYSGASGMGTVTLNYAYQFFNQRTSLSDNKGGTTTYSYNDNFQITALNYTQSGSQANVGFSYNTTTDDSLSKVTMDAGGGTDHITASYSYSSTSLSIHYTDSSANTLANLVYNIDGDARISSYTGPEGSLTYSYDADGQLTSVTDTVTTAVLYNYSLDAAGNRTGSGYTTTANSGNEMTAAAGDASMTYDNNGNLLTKIDVSGDHWTYSWDYRNRLTQVVEKNNTNTTTLLTEDFYYDVFNDLIGVATGVVTPTMDHWTVYDRKNPYMDFDSSGNLTTHYLTNPQAIGHFFARVAASGSNPVNWLLTDYQGSVRDIVRQDGTVLDTLDYDPFGNILGSSTGSTYGRFLFQGGEYLGATVNLYHFGARWYNPSEGRFISQDPIGFASGDPNLYRFTDNDPVNLTDHSGTSGTDTVVELFEGENDALAIDDDVALDDNADPNEGSEPAPNPTVQYFPLGGALVFGQPTPTNQLQPPPGSRPVTEFFPFLNNIPSIIPDGVNIFITPNNNVYVELNPVSSDVSVLGFPITFNGAASGTSGRNNSQINAMGTLRFGQTFILNNVSVTQQNRSVRVGTTTEVQTQITDSLNAFATLNLFNNRGLPQRVGLAYNIADGYRLIAAFNPIDTTDGNRVRLTVYHGVGLYLQVPLNIPTSWRSFLQGLGGLNPFNR